MEFQTNATEAHMERILNNARAVNISIFVLSCFTINTFLEFISHEVNKILILNMIIIHLKI